MLYLFLECSNRLVLRLPLSSWFAVYLSIALNLSAFSQAGTYWQEHTLQENVSKALMSDGERDHLSIRPIAIRDIPKSYFAGSDSSLVLKSYTERLWVAPDSGVWKFSFLPLLMGSVGYSNSQKTVYTSAPGVAICLQYGENWSAYGDLFYGSIRLPAYANAFLDSTGTLPSFGKNRASIGDASLLLGTARLNYTPSSYFQFELGYGKNFFGQGYRSMLLSDVAFCYPYFKITTDVWHIKYINLYSALVGTDPQSARPRQPRSKYSTTHYLSWAVSPQFNMSLFETVIWQGEDSLSSRGFDPNYLNPIIFYRPVEYGIGSPDNALIGLDLSYKINTKIVVYSQLLLDEFLLSEVRDRTGWWGNKWGAQLGLKTYDLLMPGLRLQGEFNLARPFTYTHGSVIQNFGHFQQALAHQLGTNFYEGILIAYYEEGSFFGEVFSMYAEYGRDPADQNFGGDIYRSYVNPAKQFGNEIGQGIKSDLYLQRLSGGVILNRAMNLRASLSYTLRKERTAMKSATTEHIFGLSFSTSIYNTYQEF